MTKIVHLTSVHQSYDVRVFHKECASLSAAGYNVTLVAQHTSDEVVDGIKIRSLCKPKSRFDRMIRSPLKLYEIAMEEKGSVYHFHDPELIPLGVFLKLRGKKVIYDLHEDSPRQALHKHWLKPWLRYLVSWFLSVIEKIGCLFFDGLIAATPHIAKRFSQKKTIVVQNFPRTKGLKLESETPYHERENVVVYIGGLSQERGILELVHMPEKLPISLKARLELAGNFSPESFQKDLSERDGWKKVCYLGWQNPSKIKSLLSRARVGAVVLYPTPAYQESYPIKMFEYMAAGLPVVASDFSLWQEIVSQANCGLLVDPKDPKSIAKAVQWLLDNSNEAQKMGEAGMNAVKEKYNWELEEKKLLGLYNNLTGKVVST